MTKPETTCCEIGCDKPIDRPRSRVRCAEHYTPPRYGGHAEKLSPRPVKRRGA